MQNLKTAGQRRAFEEFKHLRDTDVMDIAEVRDYIPQDMVSVFCVLVNEIIYGAEIEACLR